MIQSEQRGKERKGITQSAQRPQSSQRKTEEEGSFDCVPANDTGTSLTDIREFAKELLRRHDANPPDSKKQE